MSRTHRKPSSGAAIFAFALLTAAVHADTESLASPALSPGREQLAAMEQEMVQTFGWEPRHAAAKPASPLAAIGARKVFWAQSFGDYPFYQPFYQVNATCRAVGEHAYVFVDDGMWNKRVRQKDVDALVAAFDQRTPASSGQGIYEIDVDTFGDPPDVDGDPRIYLLLLDIKENFSGPSAGSHVLGYFSGVNEYSDQQARLQGYRSNETELLYVDCDPGDASSPLTHSVVAHEFQHSIHFNADPAEDSWINEGCSTFAEWVCGYGARLPETFKNESGNSLALWSDQTVDYEQCGMFVDYLFEHWGGKATVRALVDNPAHGAPGVTAVLQQQGYAAGFSQVLGDWAIANYLDDESVGDGRYAYANYELAQTRFADTRRHTAYPASGMGFLPYAAAHYIVFTGADDLEISFAGNSRYPLGARVIKYANGVLLKVEDFPLDNLNTGSATFADFDQIVLVPIAGEPTRGTASYSYTAKRVVESADSGEIADADPLPADGTVALAHDDGDFDYHLYWTIEGEGSGVRFTPPYQPAELLSASFFITSVRYGQTLLIRVFADDGAGKPGRELTSPLQVEAPGAGWFEVDLRPQHITVDGDFHVMFQNTRINSSSDFGYQLPITSIPFLGAENHAPVSGRSWDLFYASHPRSRYRAPQLQFVQVEDYDYAIRSTVGPVEAVPSNRALAVQAESFSLSPNYPNPFNSSTTISYQIPGADRVVLSVYNLLGQEIRRLVDAALPAGHYTATWDGVDDNGNHVASGVYLFRLQCGARNLARRMIVLE